MKALHTALALLAATANLTPGIAREIPATLRGQWRVGPVVDPSHRALPEDLAAQLAHYRLPAPGETVRTERGRLCVGSVPCYEVTWTETAFAESEYGDGLRQSLGLSAQTPVYQGDTGNRLIGYTLFGRPDHSLMALVNLCRGSGAARDCRAAYEVWHPASPDAKMVTIRPRR